MPSDNADLVAANWRDYRLARGDREDRLAAEADRAALDEVRDRISREPVAALRLLDDLLAAEEADVNYFAAGPLEDLLVEHGATVAQAIADRGLASSKWREAIGAVWLDDREWAAVEPLHPMLPPRV
jgi:hypothetical protein